MAEEEIYYGDSLKVLQSEVADESVDRIYLDPPFNSNKSHNVLFEEQDGTRAETWIKEFEDTYEWTGSSSGTWIRDGIET